MVLTRLIAGFHPLIHKSVDERRLSVWSAVSSPEKDRAGDIVEQDGIDPAVHKASGGPMGLEHLRRKGREWVIPGPGEDDLPPVLVGSAFDPDDGRYTLTTKAMPEGPVTFVEAFFDQHDRLGYQTFGLIKDGTLTGTSVEIVPTRGHSFPIGPSPLEPRQAQHIKKCSLLKIDFCATPVQQWALICKSLRGDLPAYAAQARRVIETGKVGGEAAHPAILKSLARFAPAGKSNTVTSGYAAAPVRKAMDETATAAMDPAYAPEEAAPEADAPDTYPTADGLYALADAIKAACEAALGTKGEHKKGMKVLRKLCAKADALVQEAIAAGQNVEDDLGAEDESEVEPTPDESAAVDTDETDDDGLMKAISPRGRLVLKAIKAARVKRFSKAEVAAAPVVSDTPEDLAAALAEDAAADRKLAKARRYA